MSVKSTLGKVDPTTFIDFNKKKKKAVLLRVVIYISFLVLYACIFPPVYTYMYSREEYKTHFSI